MYEGTYDPLKNLYPHVPRGGFVIVDDFGDVTACREATLEFLHNWYGFHSRPDVIEIDHTGVYWQKI
jgi:O-methyltransferase